MLHSLRVTCESLRFLGIFFGLVAAFHVGVSTPRAHAQDSPGINDALEKLAGFKPNTVKIAPMVKKGSPVRGEWRTVNASRGTWAGLTDTIGLTDLGRVFGIHFPEELKGAPGFLEFIKSSSVIIPGGTRSTFGYFVTFEADGHSKDFFILMSYDVQLLTLEGPHDAFEVFVFTAGQSSVDNAQLSTLVGGFAVQLSGTLLDEVPLKLANQRFNSNPSLAVTPGVREDGSGCLACHSHALDDLPQSTTPFPWSGSFYPTTPLQPSGAGTPPQAVNTATGSPGTTSLPAPTTSEQPPAVIGTSKGDQPTMPSASKPEVEQPKTDKPKTANIVPPSMSTDQPKIQPKKGRTQATKISKAKATGNQPVSSSAASPDAANAVVTGIGIGIGIGLGGGRMGGDRGMRDR